MTRTIIFAVMVSIFQIMASPGLAHFGMVIPSDTMVMQEDNRTITVTLSFSHPFEMVGMEMAKPKAFHVSAGGKKQDLLGSLEKVQVMDHKAWQATYPIKRPGV